MGLMTGRQARWTTYLAVSIICLSSVGCSGHLATPRQNLAELKMRATQPESSSKDASVGLGEKIDLNAEEEVSRGCVDAWRKALAGDEAGAMNELKSLDREYPQVITVRFMMGQVLERVGKKKEAVKYYREAVTKSQFSSMYLFKLAESLRTTGDTKESISRYRELLAKNPQFVPGMLGLAHSLYALDSKSSEARTVVGKVLELEPENHEAQSLHEQMIKIR